MIHTFGITILIATPAFVANMMPVIASKLKIMKILNTPIDNGVSLGGSHILGQNKTWRGLISAIVGSCAMALVLFWINSVFELDDLWIYSSIKHSVLFGVFVGFLVILGDAVGSFIKRRLRIDSGKPFIPIDQIDYIVVFLAGSYPIIQWETNQMLFLIVFAFFANTITNILSYVFGIKQTYW